MLLDSAGATRARSLTNQRGQYFFNLPADARRIRVQRIGFRAGTVGIPLAQHDLITLDIAIASLPTLITPVAVLAGGCPKRNDRGAAASLLEQARVGLLATIIARDSRPSSQLRITYRRELNSQGDRILNQIIELDSAYAGPSFVSAKRAVEYVEAGFVDKQPHRWIYHGPDAEVLLDDDFVNSYCFHIAGAEKARPNQVGIAFQPSTRVRETISVDGVLWVDTLARFVSDIQFRYRGITRAVDALNPGGTIVFRELASGVSLIDRWTLKLVTGSFMRATVPASATVGPADSFRLSESGGQLARAAWADGSTWSAPLGAFAMRARRRNGQPAAGIEIHITDSPYAGVTDESGRWFVKDLLDGPYSVVAIDPQLEGIEVSLPALRFAAVRDSTVSLDVLVPTTEEYVSQKCGVNQQALAGPSRTYVAGRLVGDGFRLRRNWTAYVSRQTSDGKWVRQKKHALIARDGLFWICTNELTLGAPTLVEFVQDGIVRHAFETSTDALVNVYRVEIDR